MPPENEATTTSQAGAAAGTEISATNEAQSTAGTLNLTQAAFNDRIAQAKRSATESTSAELLQALGVASLDEAKASFAEYKALKEASMSASEKAQAEAAKAQQEREALIKERDEFKTQFEALQSTLRKQSALTSIRDALGTTARDPKAIALWVQSEEAQPYFAAVLKEDGSVDAQKVEALLAECRKQNPQWFGVISPGSPSNAGGKTPVPSSEKARERFRADSARLIR